MAARVCPDGFFRQRRSGKDRRKAIDPRYRNPAYPEFRDRRKGERRRPEYEDCQPLIKEHPNRMWVTMVGLAMAVFLAYAFVLSNVCVSSRLLCEKKANVSSRLDLPYVLHFPF
ncbi:MAG: hypothetical protein JRI36_06235 [Deltaproteobacteria bacterium]|nr:hypothetical protein [Deltaproteobacteria bacterium]